MGRKTKKLKKFGTDDQGNLVDLTEEVEPIRTDEPVDARAAVAAFAADEPVEAAEVSTVKSGKPAEGDAAASEAAKFVVPSVSEESVEDHAATEFRAKTSLAQDAFRKTFDFVKDQKVLVDAFLVAVSFHVVMFPLLWTAGWALPWPKPPVVTTLIDYDLQEWLKTRKPKNIIEFRDPALNQ